MSAAPFPVAHAAKLWEREWREIKTEHFVIASALPQSRSIALAVELEHFRTVARMLIARAASDAFEERIPTKVYVLPYAVRDLGVDGDRVGGYLAPGMRANYAVIMEGNGDYSAEALKHEYVHFLIRNSGAQLYPPWFDEGSAELLSTLTVRNGVIEYGKPGGYSVETLRSPFWMPYPELLTYRDVGSVGTNRLGNYYAQSWLLMHYLMIGRQGHGFATEAKDFIRRSEGGEPELDAFKAAFGVDPNELRGTLTEYTRHMHYFRSQSLSMPAVEPQVRKLAVDEIAADLGVLALIHANYEPSERYYTAALAANPNNAIALAGMGDIHKHAGRFDEAERSYALAVAAQPANANHELDWGEYFLQRADTAESDPDQRRAFLTEARKHFARSFKLNPQNPETLDQNALTYLFDGEDASKAVASLEAAYDLLPSQPKIQYDLAIAYVRVGQSESARAILNRLLAWTHSGGTESIKKLIAELDANETSTEPATGRVAK